VPDTVDPEWREQFMTLPGNVEAFQAAGLAPVTIIDASRDDWDRYESLHWLAAEEWLAEHPTDPDAEGIRTQMESDRDRYLRWQRELLGWSIIVGRKG
jgi:hypothetical protein